MKCTIKKMAIIGALFIAITMWAVPNTINFQGALKDADGVPVNETQFMEFRIYDSATNGSLLWSEQHLSVTISDGIFNVELGETTPFVNLFDNAELYITFYFGGEEMAPRQQLLAVPYAMQADEATHATSADNATTVGSVGIANLVQQDGSGNATITGTMTANAFAGDGSALTGISAAYDDLYVNTTGPDTMTANTGIGGFTLTVENDGDGGAIYIPPAGYLGIFIDSTIIGLLLNSTEGNGVDVDYAGGNGVYVGSAGWDGVHVYSADDDGVSVSYVSDDGFSVTSAGDDGVFVNSAGDDGVYVYNAGSPSTQAISSSKNGFEVAGAEGNGLYVGRADYDGVRVYSAGSDGFYVHNAGVDGVSVSYSGEDGVSVYHAGTPSTEYTSDDKNGFEVAGAEGNGLFVGRADLTGVYVNSAGDDGVFVNSAGWYGVFVNSAGWDGVWANTTQASHEWGLYTPDKIYGSNVTMRSQSTHVRYVGNEMLEAGDLVCIAGGYKEDILDDGFPIINVTKANSRNSSAIIGVVEYKVYIREEIEEHEGETHTEKSFRFAEGSASYGDYLSVVVFGPADVKMDSRADIKVGEKMTVSDNGDARSINDEDNWRIGILGKALEDSNGKDTVKIFVNCK